MLLSQSDNKVKIVFVITFGEWGGAQRYVFDLATNLDKTLYEIEVWMGNENLDLRERLKTKGIHTEVIKNLKRFNPWKNFLAIFELRSRLKSAKPHIVHLNSSMAGVIGSLACHLAGIHQVIFTAHGFAFLEPRPWIIRQFYLLAEKFATRYRSMIICVSENDRQAALKHKLGKPNQLITIHLGVSPKPQSLISPKLEPQTLSNETPRIIGTIANLYPDKGLNYLVAAAHQVGTQFPAVLFEIIGEGPERNRIEKNIQKYNLSKNFLLLGSIPNASDHLSSFEIFALTSVKEGLPYTILEAMSAGLPIVATAVGGIPEMIKNRENGILVSPKNPSAFAKALIELLQNPPYAQTLGKEALLQSKKFTLQAMLQNTEMIYKTLNKIVL